MLDESSDLLTSKTQTCFFDSEIEPTFSVSCAHVSKTAVDTQTVASGTWNPDCSHTVAMLELEMDNLTSEQQMSTRSAVASVLSGQASSIVMQTATQ